jgi:hypothetical protein
VSEYRSVLERAASNFAPLDLELESVLRGRDRKRRNQRIAAGVVGIAGFVAAVWIVTSGLSLDRSEKSVVPAGTGSVQTGPAETRPVAETGPTETGPAGSAPVPALASAAPDVVKQRTCSDGAWSQLALTDLGRRILVRFEVHRSPVGHTWRITIAHGGGIMGPNFVWAFEGIRVAGDSGDFSVQLPTPDRFHSATCGTLGECPPDLFRARATDTQTGQLCKTDARIG